MHSRKFAVKYVDYALGRFFEQAKKEPFWQDTIFVVVADHGARVYGSETVPILSYEVPLLIAGPAAVTKPLRVGTPGCQLDVAPTILGLIGRLDGVPRPDLRHQRRAVRITQSQPQHRAVPRGRAVNPQPGKIGALRGKIARRSSGSRSMRTPRKPPATRQLFQTADELYMQHRYEVIRRSGRTSVRREEHERRPLGAAASAHEKTKLIWLWGTLPDLRGRQRISRLHRFQSDFKADAISYITYLSAGGGAQRAPTATTTSRCGKSTSPSQASGAWWRSASTRSPVKSWPFDGIGSQGQPGNRRGHHNLGFTVKVPEPERKPPAASSGDSALTPPFSPKLVPPK
jgi:hypothetical protein